jgi:hypothetical protein
MDRVRPVTSNLAVDTGAQVRMLAALAPVGRRSPRRYTDAIRLARRALRGLPAQWPSRARSFVGPCAARPGWTVRTRVGCRSVANQGEPLAARPRRATPSIESVAGSAGLSLPEASREVRSGSMDRVPSSVGSTSLWPCVDLTLAPQSVGPRAVYNLAVDTDAQLHTLAALALVGRRSPLRYASGEVASAPSI